MTKASSPTTMPAKVLETVSIVKARADAMAASCGDLDPGTRRTALIPAKSGSPTALVGLPLFRLRLSDRRHHLVAPIAAAVVIAGHADHLDRDAGTFSIAVVYGMAANFTFYGMVFVLSLYFQRARHYGATETGFAYLPLMATFVAVNLVSGWVVGRFGVRIPMVAGFLVDALGFSLLLLLGPASAYWHAAAILSAILLVGVAAAAAIWIPGRVARTPML